MNDGYIAQDDRGGREAGREAEGDAYAVYAARLCL